MFPSIELRCWDEASIDCEVFCVECEIDDWGTATDDGSGEGDSEGGVFSLEGSSFNIFVGRESNKKKQY